MRQLIRDQPELLAKYEKKLLESYVDDNKGVKWCPSVPCCGRAVQVGMEHLTASPRVQKYKEFGIAVAAKASLVRFRYRAYMLFVTLLCSIVLTP